MLTRISDLKLDAEVRLHRRDSRRGDAPPSPGFKAPDLKPVPGPTGAGSSEHADEQAAERLDSREMERAQKEGRVLEIGLVMPPEPEAVASPENRQASLQRLGLDLRLYGNS